MKSLLGRLFILLFIVNSASLCRAASPNYFLFSSGSTEQCPNCPLSPPLINCFTTWSGDGCETEICSNDGASYNHIECVDENGNGSGEDQMIDLTGVFPCAWVFTYEMINGHPHNMQLSVDGC
jgi:hypothetical protein